MVPNIDRSENKKASSSVPIQSTSARFHAVGATNPDKFGPPVIGNGCQLATMSTCLATIHHSLKLPYLPFSHIKVTGCQRYGGLILPEPNVNLFPPCYCCQLWQLPTRSMHVQTDLIHFTSNHEPRLHSMVEPLMSWASRARALQAAQRQEVRASWPWSEVVP